MAKKKPKKLILKTQPDFENLVDMSEQHGFDLDEMETLLATLGFQASLIEVLRYFEFVLGANRENLIEGLHEIDTDKIEEQINAMFRPTHIEKWEMRDEQKREQENQPEVDPDGRSTGEREDDVLQT